MKKDQKKMSEVIFKCLKDPTFLDKFKKDPKKVLETEFNIKLPESYKLEVVQETSQRGYIVIPSSETIKECSEEELKAIAAGCLGTIPPTASITCK